MRFITISEDDIRKDHQKNWFVFLSVEKALVESHFDWIDLHLDTHSKSLVGRGKLKADKKEYKILLSYSPFYHQRYDRIYIDDTSIKFNNDIHLYRDGSLCLYHPVIDNYAHPVMPLVKMIPWISEWIVFYELWKIYGIWLGREIKH